MKFKVSFLSLAALCAVLTGCTSISIQSTKDPQAVRKIERLFVVINHGDLVNQPYSKQIATDLTLLLTNPPPVLEISIVNPLELDESVRERQIKQFKPDAILVIRLTTAVIGEYGGYPVLKYDASLFDPETKKRLWRASVENSGATSWMERRMRQTAEVIIGRLRKDGFL